MSAENINVTENRERFSQIFRDNIKRDGAERLLDWLGSQKCDFFGAPANNTAYGDKEGGLCAHSLRVYDLLYDYMKNSEIGSALRDRAGREYSDESIAIAALLHDIYKVKTYRKEITEDGERYAEDSVPYGFAEKSVYMISGFIRLSDDEAFAIRYHLGFTVGSIDDRRTIGTALEKFGLAYALNICDMAALYCKA